MELQNIYVVLQQVLINNIFYIFNINATFNFLDLAIRCLTQAIDNKSSGSNYGLVIAFCCHHKCEYKSYIGKKYLEECKFLPNEFPILCSIASWATCGFNLKTNTELKDENKEARYA